MRALAPGSAHAPSRTRLGASDVLERLRRLYAPCVLCERRCGADRPSGETGQCGLADEVVVYNRLIHMGEEAPLVPSYAIFLSGCSMACSFCSEWKHLKPPFQRAPTAASALAREVLADIARAPAHTKPKNVNFVGGEPTVALPFIAEFVAAADSLGGQLPPLLLNTNGMLTPGALALSTHLAELFVVDFKFGNDTCASSISGIGHYWRTLTRNLLALSQPETVGDAEPGLMPVTLWVRHLLMPGHLDCCTRPVLSWLAKELRGAHVNVMPAFVPSFGDPAHRWSELAASEREAALTLLRSSGLERPFFDGRRVEP